MADDNRIEILIARFVSGEALPKEAMQLQDWVSASQDNRLYYEDALHLFGLQQNDIPANSAAWTRIEVTTEKEKRNAIHLLTKRYIVGVAASVILILGMGLLWTRYLKSNDGFVYRAENIERKITLKDHSEIFLSSNSSIALQKEFGKKERRIVLKGTATFFIIHNEASQFIIDINRFHITDIGTRFSVAAPISGDTVAITVSEGEIEVNDDFSARDRAHAGDKVYYLQSIRKLEVVHAKTAIGDTSTAVSAEDKASKSKPIFHASTGDTSRGDRSSYQAAYSQNNSYSEEGKRKIAQQDSVMTARITGDMVKDKLIKPGEAVSFSLSHETFFINGAVQSQTIQQKYQKTYESILSKGKNWIWSHRVSEADNP